MLIRVTAPFAFVPIGILAENLNYLIAYRVSKVALVISNNYHPRAIKYAMRDRACVYHVSWYDRSIWLALLVNKGVYRSEKVLI